MELPKRLVIKVTTTQNVNADLEIVNEDLIRAEPNALGIAWFKIKNQTPVATYKENEVLVLELQSAGYYKVNTPKPESLVR